MLYVYRIKDYEDSRNAAIEKHTELKGMYGEGTYDEYFFVGKEKSFISNEMEITSDCKLSDWIKGNLEFNEAEIDPIYTHKITFDNRYPIECLLEVLDYEEEEKVDVYSERILNSKDCPYVEIMKIIDETAIEMLEKALEEFQFEINEIKRTKIIKWE